MKQRTTNLGGFSLVEVLIAIGVVATGLLALMAVFITGSRSDQHGRDLSRATYYARKVTETIRSSGIAFSLHGGSIPGVGSGLNDASTQWREIDEPFAGASAALTPPVLDEDRKFKRNILMESYATTAVSTIFKMTVRVRWQGGKTGDGFRQVKVVSLLKSAS